MNAASNWRLQCTGGIAGKMGGVMSGRNKAWSCKWMVSGGRQSGKAFWGPAAASAAASAASLELAQGARALAKAQEPGGARRLHQ